MSWCHTLVTYGGAEWQTLSHLINDRNSDSAGIQTSFQMHQILPIEPQDQHQSIHRVLVDGSSMIVRFFE